MANKVDSRKETIFPLSYNPKLDKNDIKGIDIYFNLLKGAFCNSRIRNIAVTGAYGIGKSSIIKSFDIQNNLPFKSKPKFLYISLGQYGHTHSKYPNSDSMDSNLVHIADGTTNLALSASEETIPNLSEANHSVASQEDELQQQSEFSEKNAIERRLLLQIYSKFKQKDFPSSGFRQIPEHVGVLKAALFSLFAMAILLLILKTPLAQLLVSWEPQGSLFKTVIQRIRDYHELLEAGLYGITLVGAALLFAYAFQWFSPRIKNSSVSLKATNAELSLEKNACEDYLDQYTQELVYCLKRVRRKIGSTVVFEDMDRLGENVCVSIFTRLREINYILNTHLGNNEYVRFVFVVNDEIANLLVFEKFFDYVLPVIPVLNRKSSEVIFRKNLRKMNGALAASFRKEWRIGMTGIIGNQVIEFLDKHAKIKSFCCWVRMKLNIGKNAKENPSEFVGWIDWRGLISYKDSKYKPMDCFQELEGKGQDGILHMASPCLTDYRRQYAILNEYTLMVKLYCRNNQNELSCELLERILAFLIYKYLWTEDYQRSICCKQNVLTGRSIEEVAGEIHKDLLQYFVDSGVLNIRCFYNAGFSEDIVNALWRNKLCASPDAVQCEQIRDIQPDELGYVEILKAVCRVDSAQDYSPSINVLSETIKCLLRFRQIEEQSANDWFFKSRDISECLAVLNILDEEECTAFIDWCKKSEDDYDVFVKCINRDAINTLNGKWTHKMAEIFVSGVSNDRIPSGRLFLRDGQEIDLTTI